MTLTVQNVKGTCSLMLVNHVAIGLVLPMVPWNPHFQISPVITVVKQWKKMKWKKEHYNHFKEEQECIKDAFAYQDCVENGILPKCNLMYLEEFVYLGH